jgi:molybdopterin synthase sulfur carrier subunit
MARGELWRQVLGENNLMCALNQELCHPDRVIEDFDEIAFFPPVTGG